jgi:hypothetical protein
MDPFAFISHCHLPSTFRIGGDKKCGLECVLMFVRVQLRNTIYQKSNQPYASSTAAYILAFPYLLLWYYICGDPSGSYQYRARRSLRSSPPCYEGFSLSIDLPRSINPRTHLSHHSSLYTLIRSSGRVRYRKHEVSFQSRRRCISTIRMNQKHPSRAVQAFDFEYAK